MGVTGDVGWLMCGCDRGCGVADVNIAAPPFKLMHSLFQIPGDVDNFQQEGACEEEEEEGPNLVAMSAGQLDGGI